jgi:hypothetical protein
VVADELRQARTGRKPFGKSRLKTTKPRAAHRADGVRRDVPAATVLRSMPDARDEEAEGIAPTR